MNRSWLLSAALCLALAACGGGGEGDTLASPAPVLPKQWQTAAATQTSPAGQYAGTPRIAIDAAGNALMVYLRYDAGRRDAMAQRYSKATGQWSAPVPIESGDGSVNYGDIALAVDAGGHGIAVWTQLASGSQRSDLWSNRFDAASGTWGTAALLESNDTGTVFSPQVAFDGKGNAFAIWLADGDATSATRHDVWSARWDATTKAWASPVPLESDAGAPHSPQIAADANGHALAVWHQDFGAMAQIRTSRYSDGGVNAWGASAGIATQGQGAGVNVRLAMNAAGHAVAVWEQYVNSERNIAASRFDAGTSIWSAPTLLESAAAPTQNPRVTLDAAGNALAVWEQLDGLYSLVASRYVAGAGAWSAPEPLENDNTGNTAECALAGSASGDVFALWQSSDGTLLNIWANRYTPAAGWRGAAVIESTSIGAAQTPAVAALANGEAVAVWSQSDGSASSSIWDNWFR